MRSVLARHHAKVSSSVILYDTFKIPCHKLPRQNIVTGERDWYIFNADARRRRFGGAGERANIADSTRREAKDKKKEESVSRSRNSRIRCAKTKPDGQTESPLIHVGFLQAAIFCGRRNVVRIVVGCQRNSFKENARSLSENMKLFA